MRIPAAILVLFRLLVAPATASTPLDSTRTLLEQARAIVADNETHHKEFAAVSVLLGKFLDTGTLGRQAPGPHWSSFPSEQQKDFLAVFSELLERTYVEKSLFFESCISYASQQLTGSEAIVDRQAT